jgi:hypothetical protein
VNILDENIAVEQRKQLQDSGIAVRQIAYDIAWAGIQDDGIIPLLHELRQVTFFTHDLDFYHPRLCHANYCLIYLAVDKGQAAEYVRRLLRHSEFNTAAKRMGKVVRVAPTGLTVWRVHATQEVNANWNT